MAKAEPAGPPPRTRKSATMGLIGRHRGRQRPKPDREKWMPLFGKTSCFTDNLKRDAGANRSHHASGTPRLLLDEIVRSVATNKSEGLPVFLQILDMSDAGLMEERPELGVGHEPE